MRESWLGPHLALWAALTLGSLALGASGSIRDIDFKNLVYPTIRDDYPTVPSKLKWMTNAGTKQISLRNGQYRFPCDESPCPLLTLDRIIFGAINGLPGNSAVVTTTYHTGGTATWQYLYVINVQGGKPQVMAWLQTGSRADMGLRGVLIDHGDLVLTVNDPEKREGDCCSSGTITYRFRWHGGSFQQVGQPVTGDDPGGNSQQSSPDSAK